MSDDWQVVEEALTAWQAKAGEEVFVPDARDVVAAFARLREREAELERERDVARELAGEKQTSLVSLWREKYEECQSVVNKIANVDSLWDTMLKLEAAEARVKELEEALRRAAHELDQWVLADGTATYRVERAEKIIAAALDHEEEA